MGSSVSWLAIALAGVVSLITIMITVRFGGTPDYGAPGPETRDTRRKLDEIDGQLAFLSRYLSDEVPRAVVNGLRSELDSRPASSTSPDTAAALIRELSHSLNTPLAQIEAAVLSIDRSAKPDAAKLDNILEGVRICKSFLAAFREVATLTRDVRAWAPDSVAIAIRSASSLYAHRAGKSPDVSVRIADSVPGYHNNFLMAILLPLVENAMDAVPHKGFVKVIGEARGDVYVVEVSSDGVTGELPDDIYDNGFTTKHEHEGLGLATVRRLVKSKRAAELSHKVDGQVVTFTIELPRGSREH